MQLQDVLLKVIERARPWAPFFLAGLVSTAYGMVIVFFAGGQPASAFFLGDFGVCFILVGLIVIIARSQHERTQDDKGLWAGTSLVFYILVLLLAAFIGNRTSA
jgi:peptidoglycan/LPS O-acetylase OafA/YrhL